MQTYKDHTLLFFSDVLDNITLFYVIRKEVKQEMEAQGIEMNSDDEVDDDSDYESGSEDESGESEMSEHDGGSDGSSGDGDGKSPKKKKDSDSDSSDAGDNVIKATAALQAMRQKSNRENDDGE